VVWIFNRGPFILLVVLSTQTYVRTKRVGRNPLLWIALLWIVAVFMGVSAIGQHTANFVQPTIAPQADAEDRKRMRGWGEAIFEIAGAALVCYASGKPVKATLPPVPRDETPA
jgi:hypothetical protein